MDLTLPAALTAFSLTFWGLFAWSLCDRASVADDALGIDERD